MSNDRIVEIQECLRRSPKAHVVGSRTKSGLHQDVDDVIEISTQGLRGVVAYDPQEFVITVLSGTRISEVIDVLADQGQYLPFDPLLSRSQATIGGTVASNAAGAGRFRFGGIRDFLLGVRFIDGRGNCIRGGGQVVKNAAGFDYPKLMVGSLGKLGLIYELTFKVFPRPDTFATVIGHYSDLDQAWACMNSIASSAMDVEAIDLIPEVEFQGRYQLAVRIGGIASAIPSRLVRLQKVIARSEIMSDQEESTYWLDASSFAWATAGSLLKLPITPKEIPDLERTLSMVRVPRRYSVGGNVLWLAGSTGDAWASKIGNALTLIGRANASREQTKLGPFGLAIKRALDPEMKWV